MAASGDWKRLLRDLDSWTSAVEKAPGQIEVSLRQGRTSRRVVVVMTPDEWDNMASVMWGDVDEAVKHVKRTLMGLRPHERFAVYSQYSLEPSTRPMLPSPPDIAPTRGGEWVAARTERDERR